MNHLNEIARSHHCLEAVDTNTFQRQARILQSLWREDHGYPIGEHRGRPIGSHLAMPWAKQTMANFLDEDIRGVVREVLACDHSADDQPLIDESRLFCNLLSSQPLVFNLFAHLRIDTELATSVFRDMSAGRIDKVSRVDFEYAPGRGKSRYTGDHSAFDVYVRFSTAAGEDGFVGIEVKYHENLNNRPSKHHARYDEIADQMGCFKTESRHKLTGKPLQQIWRDHLLAGVHKRVDGFADGYFVFLSPRDNDACNNAVTAYRGCLACDDTFEHWTLESIMDVINQHCRKPWVAAFIDRYLCFDKVNQTDFH